MPTIQPHEAREVAEGFGSDVERYDRARPSYPPALIEDIVAAAPGRRFLDVGCGTGIATRLFRAAGCDVLGLDVDPRMPAADVVARFEDWDPAGREFDAVISAQTWHWIDPVAGAAKAFEVLAPGGILALFWNVPRPAPELARAWASAYEDAALPFKPWTGDPLAAYETMLPAFDERRDYEWERSYTRDEWLDQVPTFGGHNRLPNLEAILRRLEAATPDRFVLPYTTISTTCRARTPRRRSGR
jgi:SAM-dependent methyltransferase